MRTWAPLSSIYASKRAHVRRKFAICASATVGAASFSAAVGADPAAAATANPLGALEKSCHKRTSPDKARYRICTAMVNSFDGTPLDVTVTLPAKKRRKP